jgi:glyoxylase-like metal-dependent hydrolase (beta-lactamase superfamily II)
LQPPPQTFEDGALRLIKVGPLGPFANNAYAIADRKAGQAIVVDMPSQSARLLEAVRGLRIVAVLLTHSHPDHWAEYDEVKQATGAPVHCHPDERIIPADKIDRPLSDGDHLSVGAVSVMVLHTPGHTPGSCCFLVGRHLISGDTLFPGGPGRTNSADDLQRTIASITTSLYTLPDDTIVLPGHGDNTTIGRSRQEYAAFAARSHPPDLHGDVTWESS